MAYAISTSQLPKATTCLPPNHRWKSAACPKIGSLLQVLVFNALWNNVLFGIRGTYSEIMKPSSTRAVPWQFECNMCRRSYDSSIWQGTSCVYHCNGKSFLFFLGNLHISEKDYHSQSILYHFKTLTDFKTTDFGCRGIFIMLATFSSHFLLSW